MTDSSCMQWNDKIKHSLFNTYFSVILVFDNSDCDVSDTLLISFFPL